jgi:hypothetical protein
MFTFAACMGSKVKSPEDLMQLEGDEEVTSVVSDEEAIAVLKAIREAEEKQNNGRVSQG